MKRLLALIAIAAAACAAPRGPGELSPRTARVTNSAVRADIATLDAWQRRVEELRAARGDAPAPQRDYAVAKAGAWVAYARDLYMVDPRDALADSALDRARRLVGALESSGELSADDASLASGAPVRADLRAALDSMRGQLETREQIAGFADAELALVRAERLARGRARESESPADLREAAERSCRMEAEVIRASRLVDWLRGGPRAMVVTAAAAPRQDPPRHDPPPPPASGANTPASREGMPTIPRILVNASPSVSAAFDSVATLPAGAQPVRRRVHFAVAKATLSPASRVVLDEVVEMMRRHPGVGIALAGYTDWRAGTRYNLMLARKRALAVQDYLLTSDVDVGRVTIVAAGADSAGRSHKDRNEYARDRRVEIILLDTEGNPLTADGLAAIDHERDLQVESEAQQKKMTKLRWKGGTR